MLTAHIPEIGSVYVLINRIGTGYLFMQNSH